jgi:hypothetical protein
MSSRIFWRKSGGGPVPYSTKKKPPTTRVLELWEARLFPG